MFAVTPRYALKPLLRRVGVEMSAVNVRVNRRLPEADVVIVGLGFAGGIIAAELTKAGVDVVALERGPDRSPQASEYVRKHDELRFRVRQDMLQDAATETWTLRHDHTEPALPFRYLGAFTPATGVGGSGAHFGGVTTRYVPWEFEIATRTAERYGSAAMPEYTTARDWGIGYDELEPYYDRFEQAIGVSGMAGNLNGSIRPGGNPFEGPRAREFPLPPLKLGRGPALFRDATAALGLHPYHTPTAILSERYTSPDGIERDGCTYCGDCIWHLCSVGAKGDANVAVLPVARQSGRLEIRPDSYVAQIVHEGTRARAVRYFDSAGRLLEQPAQIVVLSAYALNNVRLLLLSGIGEVYDPATGDGIVGKNYTHQLTQPSIGFFRGEKFKNYMGAATGVLVDDFANDNFDHSGRGFIGGAQLMSAAFHMLVQGPLLPPGSPRWGRGWKTAISEWYDTTILSTIAGHCLPYRGNHLDLDPAYTDAWGLPLLRITFDWHPNERRIAAFMRDQLATIFRSMGADEVLLAPPLPEHFDTAFYQGTHNTGGAILGQAPDDSFVNPSLQSWSLPNLWSVGGSAFPQNGTPGPTGTIAALAYRAAESILEFRRGSLGRAWPVTIRPGVRSGRR
jgi:gluconate 2-dehydrogenase alpha chain